MNRQTEMQSAAEIDSAHAVECLRQMVRVRRFEERCAELYSATKIRGFLHLYSGEEAVAVGVVPLLAPDDAIVSTYREHGHALIRGISARAIMAELFGKQEGCSRGRGGSMHLFDAATRFYGGNAIVAGGLPVAVGLALADKMQSRNRVTCCFFGDGAVAEGEFHESLNLAALWKLPVLFVCENNLYAMGTRLNLAQSTTDLSRKAAVYGMASEPVDGMDVLAVREAARRAMEGIRSGAGPAFLECRTYRFRAHSMYDPELYRSKAEVEEWKRRDPISNLAALLKQQGIFHDGDLAQMEHEADKELDDAVAYAESGTPEPLSELRRFVYSDRRPA
jgi:pyruvate dehydrogenase E1 component alpha subunit